MSAGKEATTDLSIVTRAYEREKLRRKEAENILEIKSRELFLSSELIRKRNTELQNAYDKLKYQADLINGMTSKYGDITKDLMLAATIQKSLLPCPLIIPSIHAAGKFRPSHYLAGDGYDYHLINDETFAFYVVDVAGHGIASSLISFAIQKHLNAKRGLYGKYERRERKTLAEEVLETVYELNTTFCMHEMSMQFFTMVYGLIDLRTGELCFCQAGHPAPIICRKGTGIVSEHGIGSLPAGMFIDAEFSVQNITLENDDRLVVYSDGVTECADVENNEYGLDRFIEKITETLPLETVDATHYLEDDLVNWNSSGSFSDDITLMVLDYRKCL